MHLPLYGKVKLYDTSKDELLSIWQDALTKNNISITEHTKVESIQPEGSYFRVFTNTGKEYLTQTVLLAIGRRGTPRKLGIPGEEMQKVAYRLLEPERIVGKKVVVVGGGDSAIESALLLCEQNQVILSYRRDAFSRLKVKNRENITRAMEEQKLQVIFNSNLLEIQEDKVIMKIGDDMTKTIENDLVYIFAGGELPTQFLKKVGVEITKRFAYTVRKHAS
jgi:thioredoxin reductase